MLALDGYREVAVLSQGRVFRLVRAASDTGDTVLVKTGKRLRARSEDGDALRREFEIEGRLDHPALVAPLGLVETGSRPALILQDGGGTTLRHRLGEGALPLREALEIAMGIASGIAELHRNDIVHRDLRPEVVMVGEGKASVRIVDLGSATVVPRQQAIPLSPRGMLGSIAYISPEQTGRTSRPVDYRTDLYSLGVMLFEMLAGAPPFTSVEPLQLVHDHLAVPAPKLAEVNGELPGIVSDVVARLLEKDPEDRYRSAMGVLQDLERIHDRIVRGLATSDVELSGAEISTRFQLPDSLFGRAADLAEMETWLNRAAAGSASLVLVHGDAGVGKSSLIEELRSPVNELRGYLAIGKTDPSYEGPAYGPLAAALRDLASQLLTEEDERVVVLRRHLRQVLGDDAGFFVEVVPELQAVLRSVTAPKAAAPESKRRRFDELAVQVLRAVAASGPLVIVLDDVHRANDATTTFIERAVTEEVDVPLLMVAAYRSREVDEHHQVHLMRGRLIAGGVGFGDIALGPLDEPAVRGFVAAAVGRTVADAAPLAELCFRNTGGNPLSIRLLLRSLYESDQLELDPGSGAWTWDLDEVASLWPVEQPVEMAAHKIAALTEAEQTTLAVMALIGPGGDAGLLTEIGFDDPDAVLRESAGRELIELADDPPTLRWAFAHDRIREAARDLIDDATKRTWDQHIGEALQLRRLSFDSATTIFAVLRHLNAAAGSGDIPNKELAALNLEGGRSAMHATDHEGALVYYTTGVSLLGPAQWQDDPQTAFKLHLGAAEAARLMRDYEEMNRWIELISASTRDPDQLVEARLRRILYLGQCGRHAEALDVARDALSDVGMSLPARSTRRTVAAHKIRAKFRLAALPIRSERLLGGRLYETDYNASEASDGAMPTTSGMDGLMGGTASARMATVRRYQVRESSSTGTADRPTRYFPAAPVFRILELGGLGDGTTRNQIRLLNEALLPAYWADRQMLALLILKGIDLSVANGNDPTSALFYAFYGALVCSVDKDPDAGLAYADVGVSLARTLGTLAKPGRVRLTRDALVAPTKVPLREIQPSLDSIHQMGMDAGDVTVGTSALLFASLHRLLSGAKLDEVEDVAAQAERQLNLHSQGQNLIAARAVQQLVHDLRHKEPESLPFSGPYLDDAGGRVLERGSGADMASCWVHTLRATSRWFAGDVAGARNDITAGGAHLDAVLGQALVPVHHLLGVLAWTSAGGGPAARAMVRSHRRRLAWFAKRNRVQHQASLLLADGAIAASRGRAKRAQKLLGAAAGLATDRSVPMYAAIASALSAQIAAEAGDAGAAARHGRMADAAYEAWGATALIAHPDAAAPPLPPEEDDLDLTTVIRASEAIGEQIELESLVQRLMEVMLQNSGAERGVLFRVEDEQIVPEAEGVTSKTESVVTVRMLGAAVQPAVAESIVRLVARTGKPTVVSRARDDPRLSNDASIRSRGVRSVLCAPLTTQGRLTGILYLENNQADGTFTTARLRLLRILSSQAASALEKARLHEEQRRLISAQDRFVPAQFLQTLGHSNLVDVKRGEGALKVVDILFTDIRSFTTIVEHMSPPEAMEFVNEYLAHMEPVVGEHGGFIDTYDGDSILALFDAGSDAGVKAAVAMAGAERRDNEGRVAQGLAPIHTGFGINSAGVMMGIVGGVNALRATIIGDAVNVASRIESLTKRYATRMLISENTAVRLRPETRITLRPLERVQLVGKTQPLQVFEVLDALPPEVRQSRLATLDMHNEAIVAYERGEFETARKLFARMLEADPADSPIAVMLSRTNELIAAGHATSGPPVTRLETK